MNEKTQVKKYLDSGFCTMRPVYYENEARPAWEFLLKSEDRAACEAIRATFPDARHATPEEERKNRENIAQQIVFYNNIGRREKAAALIKQYNF